MQDIIFNLPDQCGMYHAALFVLIVLLTECSRRLGGLRWAIAGVIYLTVVMWYFIDPPYRMESYAEHIDRLPLVYTQVLIFLVAFRVCIGFVAAGTPTRVLRSFHPGELDRGDIIQALIGVWLVLFLLGMYRADFRFAETLFPFGNRWAVSQMWARGRFGGATDFLVSTGQYCYMLCCAGFGVIAVATQSSTVRRCMTCLICLTWPMYVLGGARSTFLTVSMPSILAILTLRRWSRFRQIAFLSVSFIGVNVLMLLVIAFRDAGMDRVLSGHASSAIESQKHLGLNMPEELVYINVYEETGLLKTAWGREYFEEAVNFVPRGLWPGKPFPGGDFSALRVGYFNGQVAATISHGLIGQGVHNFGRWIGPIAPAVFLALLTGFLCRLTKTGVPFLRSFLVLFLMALIPSLGRGLTLFTLWPAVFGYVGIRVYEQSAIGVLNHRRVPGSRDKRAGSVLDVQSSRKRSA